MARATADPAALERLGIADLRFGMESCCRTGPDHLYGLVLDGYDIGAVGPTTEEALVPTSVVGPARGLAGHDRLDRGARPADSAHSLNGLTIAGIPLAARSRDAMGSESSTGSWEPSRRCSTRRGRRSGRDGLTVALEIDDTECLGCGACDHRIDEDQLDLLIRTDDEDAAHRLVVRRSARQHRRKRSLEACRKALPALKSVSPIIG